MIVLKNYSKVSEGSDCKIYTSISLVELFGEYVVIEYHRILFRNGWQDEKRNTTVHDNSGSCYEHAEGVYNELVKVLKD